MRRLCVLSRSHVQLHLAHLVDLAVLRNLLPLHLPPLSDLTLLPLRNPVHLPRRFPPHELARLQYPTLSQIALVRVVANLDLYLLLPLPPHLLQLLPRPFPLDLLLRLVALDHLVADAPHRRTNLGESNHPHLPLLPLPHWTNQIFSLPCKTQPSRSRLRYRTLSTKFCQGSSLRLRTPSKERDGREQAQANDDDGDLCFKTIGTKGNSFDLEKYRPRRNQYIKFS